MGEVERCSPTRVLFTQDELASLDKDQLLQHWSKQENYITWMESQLSSAQIALTPVRELEEKLRNSISSESARRESVLLMRLNSKEQEIQDLIVQIQELKASQAGSPASLRSSLLDPAVNALIQHLRKELEKAKSALEETQNELSAWKFTPDSNTGKRLMAKCRLLYQENEELGRMISSGRLAKLEGDLALQRNFSEEMKKSQSELDEFLLELDEDVEGMQSTIYFLQQQLRQTRDQLIAVQKENEILRNCGSNTSLPETQLMGSPLSENLHDQSNQMYQSSSSHLIGLISDRCNGPTQHSNKRNFDKILDISGHRLSLQEPETGSSPCGFVADHSTKYLNSENVKKRIVKQEHNLGSNEEIQVSTNALLISRTNEKECGQIRSRFALEASQTDSLSYENSCGIDVKNVANDAIEPSSDLSSSNQNKTNNTVVTTDLSQQSDAVECRVDIDCCDRNKKSDCPVEPEIKKESKSLYSPSPNGSLGSADQEFNVGSIKYQDEKEVIDVSEQEGGNIFGVMSSANNVNHSFSDSIIEDGDKNLSIADQDPLKNHNTRKRALNKPEGDASSPRSSFIFKSNNQAVSESEDSSETFHCSKTLETVSMYKRSRVGPPEETPINRDKEEIEHINP